MERSKIIKKIKLRPRQVIDNNFKLKNLVQLLIKKKSWY